MIKMKFQCGTLAILEGPASFSCIADGKLQLHSGKVYVQVPLGAEGFTVQTATSKIIDLGTEFGVNAQKDGNTSLFMYKGKAS
jgi:ferric-dicitrate binding protein FerR (iron transport regulator)